MWAVLTRPEKWDEEEFFSTGAEEISEVMSYAQTLGFPRHHCAALDFGCGLGRLSRALADHFDRVVGVDIAESMIEGAKRLNGRLPGCEFQHNPAPDLGRFDSGSFDLVYSNITLQHMAPSLARGYIREFMRVVSDDGLVLFQIPTGPSGAGGAGSSVPHGLRRLRNVPAAAVRLARETVKGKPMEMNCIPEREVVELVESAEGRVLDVQANQLAGPGFESRRFAAVRTSHAPSTGGEG
jgi:SAM-dependent methyltransferase